MSPKDFSKFKAVVTKAPSSISKEEAFERCKFLYSKIDRFQNMLSANPSFGIIILFQGMDASGKDGAIRKLASQLNPQGFNVTSFKAPTQEELNHDFLWRIHAKTPEKGKISFFNRSHYEDILITKVHDLISEKTYKERIEHINNFEKLLTENNTVLIKFFLDISKEEQRERLDERINTPEKNWKYNAEDEIERKLWNKYEKIYDDIFDKCNTQYAPWYCVPADNKWYRDLVIAEIIYDILKQKFD